MRGPISGIWVIGAVGLIYFAAGRFGLSLATIHPSASAIWPPTGVAIAATMVFGPRVWPGVFAGAFLVNVTASAPLTAAIIASGNTLEALVAARLTDRYARGIAAFERPNDVFRYTVLAGFVATAVSATIGVTGLVVTGHAPAMDYLPVWLTWWLGDASGAILIAPLLILAAQVRIRRVPPPAVAEATVLAGLVALFGAALFGGFTSFSIEHRPLQFLAFPLLAWAAFRFGLLGAAMASVALEAIAVWGTLRGFGPFAGGARNDALLLLQMFGMTASVTVLALAAAITARQRAEQRLGQTERQMREVAEEAARLREEFLVIATHELRTPVTSVKGYAQLALRALERGPSDKATSAIHAIVRQSDRLSALVSQLLDASRISRGGLSIERVPVDISALVRSAVEAATVRDHGHAWSVRISPDIVGNVDPVRVDQLVGNLLDNAARYSPAGSTISVTLDGADGRARLKVADEGLGIAPDRLPRVFDRFYRAHEEERLGGLGLGLHLSREIAEKHGGTIAVTSEIGKGSTFVVDLPTSLEPTAPLPLAREGVRQRGRGRVLVVDDEGDIRRLAAEVLESAGCSVTLAQDGARALEICRGQRPDLIVLDKLMPVMDGSDFARAYRAATADPAPIVGFCAARDVAAWSASIGAVAHVSKPFDVDHLEEVVLEQLATYAAEQPPRDPARLQ